MKHIFLCGSLCAAVSLFTGCAPQGENPEKMIAEAKALDKQFVDAYNSRDVDAVMATYWNSPDLVSYPPDVMKAQGWQEVKNTFAQSFADMPPATLEVIETNYKVVGDAVISWGTWRFTINPPGGGSMEMKGRYTDVKTKRDGKWVYILDHASAPFPPPPESPGSK
jgi:uncharacterized protein (TIGR02246 family)